MVTKYLRLCYKACCVVGALVFGTGVASATDYTMRPKADTPVKGWNYPSQGDHYPLVRDMGNGAISDDSFDFFEEDNTVTDQYELTSVSAPKHGGKFPIRVKAESWDFPGYIDLSVRKGSTWLSAPQQQVPDDEAWHSYTLSLAEQSITWTQSELDNALLVLTGSANGGCTLYCDKAVFVVIGC